MCCCGKPNINGQPGYSWDGKSFGVRPVDPPALADGDELLFDEPGRCTKERGGLDSHCHHFRLVKARHGYALLTRNGCGDERIELPSWRPGLEVFFNLDSDGRYWGGEGKSGKFRVTTPDECDRPATGDTLAEAVESVMYSYDQYLRDRQEREVYRERVTS